MDGLTPAAHRLSDQPESTLGIWGLSSAGRRPHILLTGANRADRAQVRAAIEDEYHVLTVPDGRRALRLLRSIRHLVLVVAGDDLLDFDAPGLFERLAREPEMALRHAYVYLTAGSRRFGPTFAWQLEMFRVAVVHMPTPQHDLLEQLTCAARYSRLHALDLRYADGFDSGSSGSRLAGR